MDSSDPEGTNILSQLLFLGLLVLVNAFFAGAEMAVVSVNKNKIRGLAEDGNKKAQLIETLFQDSTKFLSTIQVAITLAGFFSSATAATGISQVFGDWLEQFSIPYSNTISMVGVTILLSFFTLVFGELVPKRIALQKAEQLSLFVVTPIYAVSKVASPFIKLLSISTNGFLHLIGMKTENLEEAITEEEIKAMLETGSQAGVFNDIEKEMINSIFSFDDKAARDIMVPRRDVFVLDIEEPFREQVNEILESRYSRIPVYEGNIDNIIGILDIKELLIKLRKIDQGVNIDLRTMLHEPYYVLDNRNTDELFKEMQHKHTRMALLIDEYGGFSGIVTMEDLVEEIVGDLADEHEIQVEKIEKIDENTYLLDGTVLLDDLNSKLGLHLQPENYDILSGFLIEKLEYIPTDEKVPPIIVEDNEFTLIEVKDKRINRVQLRINHQEDTPPEEMNKDIMT